MSKRKMHAGLALVILLLMACGSFSLPLPTHTSTATPEFDAMTPAPAPADIIGSTDALSPLPIHVGYGVRGRWFEILFTDPSNPASAQATGGVDVRLVEAINAARLSVHLAMYSLSLDDVRLALIRAHRRGIDVRLVSESDNMNANDFQRLKEAGIPVLGDRREGTMHDKFMVIDGQDVWTGSMNYTDSGAYMDNNTVVHIESRDLAADYEAEFAEMFDDDKFGPEPGRLTPNPQVEIGGAQIHAYFAPDDAPESALVELLDTAQHSIYFLAYSFTSNPLGNAIKRAHADGITVKGILDEDQATSNLGTEFASFRTAGLDVRLDGNRGQMHEKVFIIDGEVVVVGSYNFSRNANETNDENLLIIYDRTIAQQYLLEFERVYAHSSR